MAQFDQQGSDNISDFPMDLESTPRPFHHKVFFPSSSPQFNFLGLIIGPRGRNLRRMETISGCKITCRGRGVTGRSANVHEEEELDLHCYIQGYTQESVSINILLLC